MEKSTAVLVTLIVYKFILIGVGLLVRGRNETEEDFFLGGKKLGPLVSAISASASSSSAWTLLGVSGMAYSQGLSVLWLFPSCVGGFALNWFLVAPALRRHIAKSKALTMIDVIAESAGKKGRRLVAGYAALVVALLFTAYVASQFKAAGMTFERIFDLDLLWATLIGAGIVIFYTLLGGFWAVSLTDTLQGLLMALTALILPVVAFLHVGAGDFVSGLRAVADPNFMSLSHGREGFAALGFVMGLFGIGLAYPGQPHVVTRFMALDDKETSLGRARFYAMTWAVLIYSGMILLGLCGRILVPVLANNESILVSLAGDYLHPVIGGIMIAAVLSAIMSTADSQLLVVASCITHDLHSKTKAPSNLVLKSRQTILVTGFLALILANTWEESIFKSVASVFSAMGAAFGPVLLATILRGPVGQVRCLLAISLGFGGTILTKFVISFPADHQAFAVYFLPLVCASLVVFTKRAGPSKENS